jgi:hypothetical protein
MVTKFRSMHAAFNRRRRMLTASMKSPAAARYAEITCGVITLLVGLFISAGSTSTGSNLRVKALKRFTSSKCARRGSFQHVQNNAMRRTGHRIRRGCNRLDRGKGCLVLRDRNVVLKAG